MKPIIRIDSLEWDEAQATSTHFHDPYMQSNDSITLDDQLRGKAIVHADGIHRFWPISVIQEVLTRERILTELTTFGNLDAEPSWLAADVTNNYCKVFALLTLVGKGEHIERLIHDGVTDQCLPLKPCETIHYTLCQRNAPSRPLACFKTFKPCERELFLQYQHRVNPEFLGFTQDGKTVEHRVMQSGAILPFTSMKAMRAGGYSNITKVTVHPNCHGFKDFLRSIVVNDEFAMKELLATVTAEEFQKELEALKQFTHDHLVTLLMSWILNGRYYLLFPLAGYNLEDYWDESPQLDRTKLIDTDTVQWISKQMVGLAGALNALHEPPQFLQAVPKYGRHGDIKPENILWYRSNEDRKGILVIADLGLAAIHSDKSRSNIPNLGIPGTPGYRPPECDLEGGKISRSYDIWTFGCLLLEMVCWALGGNENRNAFEKHRESTYITGVVTDIFFDVQFKDTAAGGGYVIMVKRQVREWICQLHNEPACTQYFHDLLDLVETKMIVTLSRDQNRIRSLSLLETLATMHQRVMDSADAYCRQPCPRKEQVREPEPVDATLNHMAKATVRNQNPSLSTHKGWTQTSKSKQELEHIP